MFLEVLICMYTYTFILTYIYILFHIYMCLLFVSLIGLAVGLGIGALAEVAKKTIRHSGMAGK